MMGFIINLMKLIFLYIIKGGGPLLLGRNFINSFELSINKVSDTKETYCIVEILKHDLAKTFSNVLCSASDCYNRGNIRLRLREGAHS